MALAVTLVPTIASAKIQYLDVTNRSDRCAWITVYGAGMLSPWSILTVPERSRPHFLKPGETHNFRVTYTTAYSEVKVRAEVKENAQCGGRTTADTYDVYKQHNSEHDQNLEATLGGSSGTYWMKI